MALTEAQIAQLIQANPFRSRGVWIRLDKQIGAELNAETDTYFAAFLLRAQHSLQWLGYLLDTPTEILQVRNARKLASVKVAASNTVFSLFTSPAGQRTILRELIMTSDDPADQSIRIYHSLNTQTLIEGHLIFDLAVGAKPKNNRVLQMNLELAPGDFISFKASSVNLYLSLYGVN